MPFSMYLIGYLFLSGALVSVLSLMRGLYKKEYKFSITQFLSCVISLISLMFLVMQVDLMNTPKFTYGMLVPAAITFAFGILYQHFSFIAIFFCPNKYLLIKRYL